MKNKLLGNDPKTLFIGGANERGEYTSPLSGRTASEDFFHLLEEFAKRRLKKKDSQDFNILFEIPEYEPTRVFRRQFILSPNWGNDRNRT